MPVDKDYPPHVEAALILASKPVREAVDQFETVCDYFIEHHDRRPNAAHMQRVLLGALVRAGGTDDDVRFLIAHGFADDEDLAYWRRQYPHATRRPA